MRILGVLLIVLGLAGLLYGGFTWTRREKVVDLGPVEVTNEHTKSLPLPPLVGGTARAAGGLTFEGQNKPSNHRTIDSSTIGSDSSMVR